jgi:polysaccharide biosynthesis transport protein
MPKEQPQQPQIIYQLAEPDDTSTSGPDVHLWDYVQIVLQRLPLALIVGTTVMLIAGIYTWTRIPRYTSTARLLVEPNQVNLTDMKGAIDPVASSMGKREYMQTQALLLKSRPVISAVIDKLGLMSDAGFKDAKDPIALLQSQISVTPTRNSYLIDISTERKSPGQARAIVNATIDAFMSETRHRMLGVSEEGLAELKQKAETLRARLDTATETLQAFMVDNGMASFERTQNVVLDRLRDLSKELTDIQPERMALQAKVEAAEAAIAKGESMTSLPETIANPVIRDLKLQLIRLGNEYSQLVERLGENHPTLQALSTQIQALQTKTILEATAILSALKTEFQQTEARERLLATAIGEQQERVYRFNRLASEYDVLRQSKEAVQGPYATISRRIEEIDISRIGGQGENIFVVHRGTLPLTKSWPSRKKNILVAFVLAGALAVGLCFFLDYMDTTIKGEVDVRRLLNSKVLAAMPNIKSKGETTGESDLVSFDNPRSHTAEAFRTLRTALAFSYPGENIKSLVVSSALPSEGKSLAALNLAITQAQANKRTLLIDADMRKPRIHKVFNLTNRQGLSGLLAGTETRDLTELTVATQIENLDFLPCGPIPRSPVELIEGERFSGLMERILEEYDFVVIDSPPGFSLVDSIVMAKHTDGLLLVVRGFVTPKAAAAQFVNRLTEVDARLLGVVMNNVDTPRGSIYGTGYYYGGTAKEGKYYREDDRAEA